MNTENMRQYFESDGSPRRLDGGTDQGSLRCDGVVGGRDEVVEAGADKGKTVAQLHAEVFDPKISDLDYFLSRCRHHGIKTPNIADEPRPCK